MNGKITEVKGKLSGFTLGHPKLLWVAYHPWKLIVSRRTWTFEFGVARNTFRDGQRFFVCKLYRWQA